ncbi:MAG: dynamin family protein [Anaerolineales bacterium]|nr:dynamin family protein [Anaerolineales bacterium]
MTFAAWLNDAQKRIWTGERAVLQCAFDVLSGWEAEPADLEHLRRALQQLDELFLLVVVGEFNSGKSALINALLGESFLPEGPTPTTDRVYVLAHGPTGVPEFLQDDIRLLRYPAELLRQVRIVDTPGTNAVLRRHEAIARDFVPRSDLVLFVTSADRPFTESERAFLEGIRQWGKKVVVVINKDDVLDGEAARSEVETFVRSQVRRLLDFDPELFLVSARAGLRAPESPAAEGFRRFRDYLRDTLTQAHLVELKLRSPLGVAAKLADQYQAKAAGRLQMLAEDAQALRLAEEQWAAYEADMQAEFERHRARIENDLLQMSLRGETFLDDHMRLMKLGEMLLHGDRMRAAFENEVVADTPEKVSLHVQEVIDWLVERELGVWRRTAVELGRRRETSALHEAAQDAAGGFVYNRRQLLESLGAQAEGVIRGYDRTVESERLTVTVRESVAMTGLVEVGALGLGLLLKVLLTTAAADATGLVAAGVLGVVGLAVIPWRRGVAKRDFRKKMEALRTRLEAALAENFRSELGRGLERLRQSMAPYRNFVRGEEDRLERVSAGLDEISGRLAALEAAVDEAAPAG